jgi:hypothetical protein
LVENGQILWFKHTMGVLVPPLHIYITHTSAQKCILDWQKIDRCRRQSEM